MTNANPGIDEVLRHHSVTTTDQAWRTNYEMRRHEAIQRRLVVQDFGKALGIVGGFVGLLILGVTVVTHFAAKDPATNPLVTGVMGGGSVLSAASVYIYFARRQAKTYPTLAEFAPFVTTSAAAWAYSQVHEDGADSEQADVLRLALAAKPVAEHVAMPEHTDLLLLGFAASIRNTASRPQPPAGTDRVPLPPTERHRQS